MKENKINIELTLDEINLVLSSLSELPFKVVNDIILNIKEQAQMELQRINNPVLFNNLEKNEKQ